ncbi:GNAT family N-acetyltransferase [Bacteroides reticulotermitis]|uniref:Ribosomal-protein-L7p-serine acetyltransferase n=2 Tax=Bacteroides reticulotermitis TaxID=1133319 RepID=W4UVL9_9BACE|nr:GNAT family N-acetyltransferase [Bacteroides reticulotermitis]MBB4042750.1 RimJ/RimL family protein N-acetyltransferase [Bacteroides reticulotermitis]GAE85280.1 ribosomal-protein-L7p-serine acetyltransferase [Bacteroides reticulotermitis JCM 10512]
MIIIQQETYTLRTWEPADAPSLAQQLNNKKLWDNCRDGLPFPYSQEDGDFFIQLVKQKDGVHDFCIEVEGKAVGNIGFVPGNDVERFSAEVGYILGESYWNRGIMTDALREAISYYFETTDIVRLFAFIFEYNPASMRVLEKVGFSKVGIMHRAVYKNDQFWDGHYYELLK